jgi:hypothetical protein
LEANEPGLALFEHEWHGNNSGPSCRSPERYPNHMGFTAYLPASLKTPAAKNAIVLLPQGFAAPIVIDDRGQSPLLNKLLKGTAQLLSHLHSCRLVDRAGFGCRWESHSVSQQGLPPTLHEKLSGQVSRCESQPSVADWCPDRHAGHNHPPAWPCRFDERTRSCPGSLVQRLGPGTWVTAAPKASARLR